MEAAPPLHQPSYVHGLANFFSDPEESNKCHDHNYYIMLAFLWSENHYQFPSISSQLDSGLCLDSMVSSLMLLSTNLGRVWEKCFFLKSDALKHMYKVGHLLIKDRCENRSVDCVGEFPPQDCYSTQTSRAVQFLSELPFHFGISHPLFRVSLFLKTA